MADYRQISVTETDGVTVVRFNDQRILDAGSIQQLGEDLFQLVEVDERDKSQFRRRRVLIECGAESVNHPGQEGKRA